MDRINKTGLNDKSKTIKKYENLLLFVKNVFNLIIQPVNIATIFDTEDTDVK